MEDSNYTVCDFVGIMRSSVITDCTFEFIKPASLIKKHYIGGLSDTGDTKEGNNKIIYGKKIIFLTN